MLVCFKRVRFDGLQNLVESDVVQAKRIAVDELEILTMLIDWLEVILDLQKLLDVHFLQVVGQDTRKQWVDGSHIILNLAFLELLASQILPNCLLNDFINLNADRVGKLSLPLYISRIVGLILQFH